MRAQPSPNLRRRTPLRSEGLGWGPLTSGLMLSRRGPCDEHSKPMKPCFGAPPPRGHRRAPANRVPAPFTAIGLIQQTASQEEPRATGVRREAAPSSTSPCNSRRMAFTRTRGSPRLHRAGKIFAWARCAGHGASGPVVSGVAPDVQLGLSRRARRKRTWYGVGVSCGARVFNGIDGPSV